MSEEEHAAGFEDIRRKSRGEAGSERGTAKRSQTRIL